MARTRESGVRSQPALRPLHCRRSAGPVAGRSLQFFHHLNPRITMSKNTGKKRIAVIAGDGIGKETMPEGLRVMEAAASKFGIDLQFDHFDFSSWDYFEK